MNKIVKQSKAGNLWKGVGYLVVGLQRIDVKIVKNNSQNQKAPKFKLVQYDKNNPEFQRTICGLFEEKTKNGKKYYVGTIELGFGVMQIKIFTLEPKTEKSPTSIIFGRLLMENLDKSSNEKEDIPQVDIDDEDIPF